jgi:hypothetical protein
VAQLTANAKRGDVWVTGKTASDLRKGDEVTFGPPFSGRLYKALLARANTPVKLVTIVTFG